MGNSCRVSVTWTSCPDCTKHVEEDRLSGLQDKKVRWGAEGFPSVQEGDVAIRQPCLERTVAREDVRVHA